MAKDVIDWFEIPATDFERALKFYETIFAMSPGAMQKFDFGGGKMGMFPKDSMNEGVGGAVWCDGGKSKPSVDGVRIYLAAEGQIEAILGRVPSAGGRVAAPKTGIGPYGFIALVADTEGNVVGLHSMS